MSNKISFEFLGKNYSSNGYTSEFNGVKQINIDCVGCGQMVRQYIKHKFPKRDFKYWVRTEKYSMGSSLDIYLCNKDGSRVSEEIYEEIDSFSRILQWGRFNGMIDMYESKEIKYKTDEGVELNFYTKYVFCHNRPPYGTQEAEIQKSNNLCA